MSAESIRALEAAAGLLILIGGGWLFAVKWLLKSMKEHIDQRLDALAKEQNAWKDKVGDVEKEILRLRVEVAEKYMAREDWVRQSVSITAKIDGLAERVDRVLMEREDAGKSRGEAA